MGGEKIDECSDFTPPKWSQLCKRKSKKPPEIVKCVLKKLTGLTGGEDSGTESRKMFSVVGSCLFSPGKRDLVGTLCK